jgi:hypothetical protein
MQDVDFPAAQVLYCVAFKIWLAAVTEYVGIEACFADQAAWAVTSRKRRGFPRRFGIVL